MVHISMTGRRFIAYLLDFCIICAIIWPIAYLLFTRFNYYYMIQLYQDWLIVNPFVVLIYFVFCEKIKGTTMGKLLTFIEVEDIGGGRISYKQSIIRNISKIYGVFIIFDLLLGQLYGNKSERILGQLSKTKVVQEDLSKFSD